MDFKSELTCKLCGINPCEMDKPPGEDCSEEIARATEVLNFLFTPADIAELNERGGTVRVQINDGIKYIGGITWVKSEDADREDQQVSIIGEDFVRCVPKERK